MANKDCIRRLQREYQKLLKEPSPEFIALPNPDNILEWHFLIEGPAGTPYQGGTYHGKLKFPDQYPHKPPSIMMVTPSGRFIPETRLCLSYSDFHPETWNPMWNVSTILTGLVSFMTSNEESVGTVVTADSVKRVYAKASMEFNLKNPTFRKFFESRCQDQSSSPTASSSSSAPSSSSPFSSKSISSSSSAKNMPQKSSAATQEAKPPTRPAIPTLQEETPAPRNLPPPPAAVPALPKSKSKSSSNTPLAIFIMLLVAALAIYLNRML